MSDFYSVVILLAVLIMVIMDLLVSSNDLLDTDKKQTVYTISVLVIAGALSEWLGVLMNGALPALRPLHLLVKALEDIAAFDICREHGIIVAESAAETELPALAPPYSLYRQYRYGKIKLSVYHRSGNEDTL